MPHVSWPVSNLQWSVSRPVAMRIIRDLMDATQISSSTPITFADENVQGVTYQPGSTISKSPLEGQNRWPYDQRVIVEVNEQYLPEDAGTTAVYRIENPPFLVDDDLGLYAAPVYRNTKLEINFKFKSRDRNHVIRWNDAMVSKASQLRDVCLHEATYNFTIPQELLNTLEEIYAMSEKKYGYGVSWNTFLTDRLFRNVGLITNFSMTDSVWAVSVTLNRLAGYFDFAPIPDAPTKEDDGDNWIGGFTYTVSYMKPIECSLIYPYVVHQQLIAAPYRPVQATYLLDHDRASRTLSMTALKKFESDSKLKQARGLEGITLPSFDDFSPAPGNVLASTVKVLTTLVILDENDPRYLFNLEDLGDLQLRPEIIALMKTREYPYLGNDFRSIFSLSLYKGPFLQNNGSLVVDANLNVRSTQDLDPRSVYHVRLGLVTNFNFISTPGLIRVKAHQSIPMIIAAMNASMKGMNMLRSDIRHREIPLIDVRSVTEPNFDMSTIRGYHALTVQDLFIRGGRMPEPVDGSKSTRDTLTPAI